ncbi:hypothetical protein SNEBB_010886 [Seison nebaliae]|nr:hypothetical protein SNEBB_010886 [Seison nebaliae]
MVKCCTKRCYLRCECCPKGCCTQEKDNIYINPTIKYLLYTFNFLIWPIGLAFVGIGFYIIYQKRVYYQTEIAAFSILDDIGILLIVIGIVVFIFAFIGCIGALREQIILLKIFSIGLIVLLSIQILLGIMLLSFSSRIQRSITETMLKKGIPSYLVDVDMTTLADGIQKNLKCCGVRSFEDWQLNEYFNNPISNLYEAVPYSCCKYKVDSLTNFRCGAGMLNKDLSALQRSNVIYTDGCFIQIYKEFKGKLDIFAIVIIILFTMLIGGVWLSWLLKSQIEREQVEFEHTPQIELTPISTALHNEEKLYPTIT